MVDTKDLKSFGESRAGSIPAPSTRESKGGAATGHEPGSSNPPTGGYR